MKITMAMKMNATIMAPIIWDEKDLPRLAPVTSTEKFSCVSLILRNSSSAGLMSLILSRFVSITTPVGFDVPNSVNFLTEKSALNFDLKKESMPVVSLSVLIVKVEPPFNDMSLSRNWFVVM